MAQGFSDVEASFDQDSGLLTICADGSGTLNINCNVDENDKVVMINGQFLRIVVNGQELSLNCDAVKKITFTKTKQGVNTANMDTQDFSNLECVNYEMATTFEDVDLMLMPSNDETSNILFPSGIDQGTLNVMNVNPLDTLDLSGIDSSVNINLDLIDTPQILDTDGNATIQFDAPFRNTIGTTDDDTFFMDMIPGGTRTVDGGAGADTLNVGPPGISLNDDGATLSAIGFGDISYTNIETIVAEAGNGTTLSDLVFPWVTNNSTFQSVLSIVNLNDSSVDLTLSAARPSGSAEVETDQTTLNLGPLEQRVVAAGDLFPALGPGPGFRVRLTSSAANIEAGFLVSSTQTESGDSPAQANVVPVDRAANNLLFTYLPNSGDGFAAPVVVNMSDVEAQVTFTAYHDGAVAGSPAVRTIPAGRPLAELVTTLFPDVTGDLYVIAESEASLLGTSFIFNSLREPSMANAVAVDGLPDP